MILYPLWKPFFMELDDADQEIALATEQAVNLLAGLAVIFPC
jgi:hypothetical protein